MKLQNIIYPSTKNCTEELLYFRRDGKVKYRLSDACITLSQNSLVSFDTYFNSFSVGKWFKYTKISNVLLKLKVKGNGCVRMVYKEKQPDQIFTHIMHEHVFNTADIEEITLPFTYERKQGMYTFEIMAFEDECQFFEGAYYTDIPKEEVQKIKLGIIICTFRREDFVYKNMRLLEENFVNTADIEAKDILEVYISDNSQSLDKERMSSSFINVYPNKNVGGSGGFTRGLIECLKRKEKSGVTHALLMDDDVVIQPESIYRTYRILSVLKPEYKNAYIGGAMLRTDRQWYQTEAGGLWNAGALISRKVGLDLRTLDACLYNEFEEKCDFNAWWYCTIPMDVVREDNLPIPIFIRGDDVEYGIRNMRNLILMNGICVWHEPFEYKFSSSLYYYIFRNRLIDNAIHGIPYPKERFLNELKDWLMRELFTYRYKNAQLLLDGANDFLKGIEWLKQQDGEVLNKEIMAKGYKMQYINELEVPFDFPTYKNTIGQTEGKKHQLMRKLLLNGMFLKPQGDAIVPTVDPHILYFYRKARVLNYDYMSQKGFVTYRDNKEFSRLYKEFKKLKKICGERYDTVMKEYRDHGRELMQIEFWNNYLELNPGKEEV